MRALHFWIGALTLLVVPLGHGWANDECPVVHPGDMWIVQTRDCPKAIGTDVWPCLKVYQLDHGGRPVERKLNELWRKINGRPVLILVQGIQVSFDLAIDGMFKTQRWLMGQHAVPANAVIITFDWPSHADHIFQIKNVNEECRRAIVAGSHLAQFLQAFPPQSRICLLGHSHGGRAIAASLHLLGGGTLGNAPPGRPFRLEEPRTDLHVRAVAIASGIDHHWLNPGEKLGNTLRGCEAFLHLVNRKDPVLLLYPLMANGDHSSALGRVGLSAQDRERLGSLVNKYAERDISPLVGRTHKLIYVLGVPEIAEWLAPYTGAERGVHGAENRSLAD